MSPPPSRAASTGLLLALASAGLYGVNIGYARLASFAGVSGSTIVVYRVLLMLGLVAAAALVLRRSLAVPAEERRTVALLGVATAFVGVCYLSSVAFIPVAVAVVVFYTFPVLIVLASPLVEGTRLTPALLGVVALALLGVGLVVGPAFESLDWRGIALALGASVATATQFFAAARARRTDIVAKTFWIHAGVLPTALVIGLLAGNLAPPQALLLAPLAVAVTIGAYVVGFLLQFLALARISAVAAGIVYCAEPVVAALSSTLILGEALSPIQLLGGALVIAAIVTNAVLDNRRAAMVATD
ncbi:MAG TPA: DMT family transporter [Microvirga sp.]|jgi:drug/metabolite transporter (DMT)-like permease